MNRPLISTTSLSEGFSVPVIFNLVEIRVNGYVDEEGHEFELEY